MKTCLVVDDSRVIRKVARRILEDLGFEVAEAGDGLEAMSWCHADMPDAILLDWRMPVMDGLEFVRRLRAEPGGDRPRVVFCSVENDLERIREALDAGADEYIMKPFDGEIVASKLAHVGLAHVGPAHVGLAA
ncbi:chemotaxis protein CheYIV [Phenylobacterium zucineum HLK1]|uniref:Chemotaxis protein CheYIV n=1 Tax=Phenylobacterium zucineum (strain HLK1) TaxID=450851 RepID=B4RDA7_PHEZH|nr:response regulator [Phenylobacterium zucineum]ACG76711.1 chemotaxis protein CheYIV [Phenylobacterium zucineum HLK1]